MTQVRHLKPLRRPAPEAAEREIPLRPDAGPETRLRFGDGVWLLLPPLEDSFGEGTDLYTSPQWNFLIGTVDVPLDPHKANFFGLTLWPGFSALGPPKSEPLFADWSSHAAGGGVEAAGAVRLRAAASHGARGAPGVATHRRGGGGAPQVAASSLLLGQPPGKKRQGPYFIPFWRIGSPRLFFEHAHLFRAVRGEQHTQKSSSSHCPGTFFGVLGSSPHASPPNKKAHQTG